MSAAIEKQVYFVSDIMTILGIGRSKAYELVNSSVFRTLKVGGQIIVPKKSFDFWLNGKEEIPEPVNSAISEIA